MNKTEEANEERHYIFMVVAMAVTLVGVYLRFVGNPDYYAHYSDWYMYIGNTTMILGVILCLKSIYNILK